MSSVVVAGSGQRGLICAAKLAAAGMDVVVVERLPHPGGQEPERTTERLAKAARQAGARFVLGTLAVQYDGTVVDVLGVDGAGSLPCNVLVVATGSRPATRAELGPSIAAISRITRSASAPSGTFSTNLVVTLAPSAFSISLRP